MLTHREASALEADSVIFDVIDGQDGVEYFSNGVVSVIEDTLVEAGKERHASCCGSKWMDIRLNNQVAFRQACISASTQFKDMQT